MKDFDIAKYLKENNLGSYGILGGYVDLNPLKEEEKVPYEGPEHRLDGDSLELDPDMDVSMNEDGEYKLQKPEKIYADEPEPTDNNWMTSENVDDKKVGQWTAYLEDIHNSVIYWLHDKINSEDLVVYATPDWEGEDGIACEVVIDTGHIMDQITIGKKFYKDFESYAVDVKPYLDQVEKDYFTGKYNHYLANPVQSDNQQGGIEEETSLEENTLASYFSNSNKSVKMIASQIDSELANGGYQGDLDALFDLILELAQEYKFDNSADDWD